MLNAEHATSIDRRAERTHLFVVATLYFGQASTPVRLRNLSMTGALIEGADLPPAGTEIVLRRGNLEAAGTAVWSEAGRAGLAFRWPVAVSAWLPNKEPTRQAQVDRMAYEVRQGARAFDVAPLLSIGDTPQSTPAVVTELVALQAELCELADNLPRYDPRRHTPRNPVPRRRWTATRESRRGHQGRTRLGRQKLRIAIGPASWSCGADRLG